MDPRTLQAGAAGEDVKGMQLGLNRHLSAGGTSGPAIGDGTLKPLEPNGQFDEATAGVVRAFQAANGLPATGAIDRATRYAIFPLGVLSVMLTIDRLQVPWLLETREPSWGRPPRLLPRLQLGEEPAVSGAAVPHQAGPGRRATPQAATSLDAPWLLYPRQPHWRSPPSLVPPLQMPGPDHAPRPAPVTAGTDGRSLSPGWRSLDPSRVDIGDPARWAPRPLDCSNIDWPIRGLSPLAVDWRSIVGWQDDGTHGRIGARPLADSAPAPKLPSPAADHDPASASTSWVYDHAELQAGSQLSLMSDGSKPKAVVASFQTVYRKGPDDGAHLERGWGFQLGVPILVKTGESDLVSINPYYYLADVDRHWHFGAFHLWQPLAQAGFQLTPNGRGRPWNPTITATACPVNLEYDPNDFIKMTVQGCGALNVSVLDGSAVVGLQGSGAVTIQLEKFYSALKPHMPSWFGGQ